MSDFTVHSLEMSENVPNDGIEYFCVNGIKVSSKFTSVVEVEVGGETTYKYNNEKMDKYLISGNETNVPVDYTSIIEVDVDCIINREREKMGTYVIPNNEINVAEDYTSIIEVDVDRNINAECCEKVHVSHCDKLPLEQSSQGNDINVNTYVSTVKKDEVLRKCCVNGCIRGKQSLFSFPAVMSGQMHMRNLNRCRLWVKRSGNHKLLKVPITKLFRKFYMCGHHFENNQFYNCKRNRLVPDAVPSVNLPEPLEDRAFLASKNVDIDCSDCVIGSNGTESVTESSQHCMLDNLQEKFDEDMNSLNWYTCDFCKETFISKRVLKKTCFHNKSCQDYCEVNNMDPGPVPEQLQGLTYVEEQLIARVNPVVSVYKVKGQQYHYSGNVINFPQKVEEFATKLPHKISDMYSMLTVRTESNNGHRDFRVRSKKVKDALIWLKENNMYYHDIEISEENLMELPDDGDVLNLVNGLDIEENEMTFNELGEEFVDGDLEDRPNINDIETSYTCVPMIGMPSQDEQIGNVVDWPTIGKVAIDEFKTEGYIAQAFPCLYPTGKADLRAQRTRNVNPTNYFKHMLRYYDHRFARHPRFRFFALNSLMRWTAMTDGNVFVSKNEELKDYTVQELKLKVQQNPQYLRKVMFHCANLKGTKPYWKARSQELISMIEQLGMPTVFITLSAADLHWPELYKILVPNLVEEDLTESQRQKLIQENPMIVDHFFTERIESFINRVLVPKYKVVDFWYRFEYQHRGSPHIHGVFWFANAPDVSDIENLNGEETEKIIRYFDEIVSTMHPNIDALPAVVHPCRRKLREVINFDEDLAQLLNKVQRHTHCSDSYCLRKKGKSQMKECRFKFPQELSAESKIVLEDQDVKFVPKRNDPLLNKYNSYIFQTWRANIDISPVLSKRALIAYLAKYIAKFETKSKEFDDIVKESFQRTDDQKKSKSVIQKLFIKACSERDYSAQEVCHLLMGDKLYSAGGREFLTLNFKSDNDWIKINTGKMGRSKTIFEKYIERSDRFENVSLWCMAKSYHLSSEKKRKKAAILQIYPNRQYLKEENEENFFQIQVLLHVPWRDESDFDIVNSSWKQHYEEHRNAIEVEERGYVVFETDNVSESDSEPVLDEQTEPVEEWMAVSKMGPHQAVVDVELGYREIDLNNNWDEAIDKYTDTGDGHFLRSFIKESKSSCFEDQSEDVHDLTTMTLTKEQEDVLHLLQLQINSIQSCNGENCESKRVPKKIIVQGKAGTGKSMLIHKIREIVEKEIGRDAIKIFTPTGVAAAQINGATLNSGLHIPRKVEDFDKLQGGAEKTFCNEFQGTQFLVIDEYSMVGCKMLGMVEQRCRQGTGVSDEYFGGLFVFLFGDLKQLPPVMDTPLYSDVAPKSTIGIHGWATFNNFDGSIILSEVKRQNDEVLKNVLENISKGQVTEDDYDILKSRFICNVSLEERNKFINAIQLHPFVEKVKEVNFEYIKSLRCPISNQPVPIAVLKSKNNCSEAEKATAEDAGGLQQSLYLGRGMKIMLKSNLWTARGLVNGAMGKVIDIIYEKGCKSPCDTPTAIICTFETFKGPFLKNISKLVAIPVVTTNWISKSGQNCARTQFPLVAGYSCSIHKSQGLTMDQL